MGVNLSGTTPKNPYRKTSILDDILDAAGSLGDGLASGFKGLLDGLGNILSDAGHVVGDVFHGVVRGVTDFIGWIGSAIGNIFPGGGGQADPPPPPPPIYNPIMTNLEAVLQPKFDEVDRLLEDSAGLGDESKTINQQMRELLDPENPDSDLWEMQTEINDLKDQRDDTQDTAIRALREAQEAQMQGISRTIFVPRGQPIEDDYFLVDYWPGNEHDWQVTAKGDWVGHYVWQSTYYPSQGEIAPAIDGHRVGGTTSRTQQCVAWARHQSILTYFVEPGVAMVEDREQGASTPDRDEWSQITTFNFTAPHDADYLIYFRNGWDQATFDDTYGIRVIKNGVTEIGKINPRTGVGPRFPWDNGYRTQTITLESVPLKTGDTLTFELWAGSTDPAERRSRQSWMKLSWIAPPVNESGIYGLETNPGSVGFVHTDMYPEINWDPNGSIQFPDFPVTTNKTVRSENDAFDIVDIAPDTVIPTGRRIYSVIDSAETVMFTRAD